jgi:hypothetical protein
MNNEGAWMNADALKTKAHSVKMSAVQAKMNA